MRLSDHFADWEFSCRCGVCYGIFPVSDILLRALEQLRGLAGRPIHITSGSRCPDHNDEVGGSPRSRHLTEWDDEERETDGADIVIAGWGPRKAFNFARLVHEFDNGGLGVYDARGFLHVDTRGSKARWAQLEIGEPMVGIPRNFYRKAKS